MTVQKKQYYEQRVHRITPAEAKLLFRTLGAQGNILDVACGSGDFGVHAPAGCIMYGFDHDQHAKHLKGYKDVRVLDITKKGQLPYKASMFQGALLKDILEHLDDPLDALQKIIPVIAMGGRVLITVPNANPRNVWNDYTHRRGFTKGAIRMLCEDAGLRIVKIKRTGGVPGCGILGLNGLAHMIVNTPILGMPFRTGWMVVCER